MLNIDELKFDEKGLTCFWSRSRQELWLKGETSGNYQHVVSITADCDNDALVVMVDPRYYYDSLIPVMNQYGITDVLYLYNADTFFNDTSLSDVLIEAAEMPAAAPGSAQDGTVG